MTTTQRDKLSKQIKDSVCDMVDELDENELNMLHDFIVNYCDNTDFIEDDGQFPNVFRMGGFVSNENAQ